MKTKSDTLRATGFTLIELLVTITIIIILAGLSMGGYNYVIQKQAMSQAATQIALLSKALEEYKLENGTYPPTDDSSQGYNTTTTPPTSITVYDINGDPSNLLTLLYKNGVNNKTTIYLPLLDPANNKQGWTSITTNDINDPWENPYRYRTASGKPIKNTDGTVTIPTNPSTNNPDFDLWTSGKDGVSGNADDIRN